jgi:signal transduction histidine kinase
MNETARFPWRRVKLVLAAVVICFVAATGVSDFSAGAIDEAALQIANTTAPGIEHLAAARAELRTLQLVARLHVEEAAAGEVGHRAELRQARRQIDDEIAAYVALHASPDEQATRALDWRGGPELDAALDRMQRALDRGERHAALVVINTDLTRAAEASSAVFLAAIEQNAGRARTLALRIEATHNRSRNLALALDLVSALVTLFAALSVKSASYRYAALVEENRRLLEERAEELEMFAGRVAHDILSPLSPVGIAVDLVSRQLEDGDPRKAWLVRAGAALGRVKQIVEGLLVFARAGATAEPGERADVATVLADVLDGMRDQAAAASVVLVARAEGAGEVACSAGLLSSALGNLVQNAIKHMDDATVRRVTVRVEPGSERVRIWVEDTGPGLPPDSGKNIFDPYVRAPGSRLPGIGLGLATLRRVVEAHGGEVGVVSSPGQGCRFWFELPRPASSSAAPGYPERSGRGLAPDPSGA